LQRRADILGIGAQVHFRGFDPSVRHKLPGYCAYVHACTVEAGPIAILEAMAAGLPIFAPPSGGVSDFLSDGNEGFHWASDDPARAATHLISRMRDQASLRRAGEAARRKFATSYATSVVAPHLAALLSREPSTQSGHCHVRRASSTEPRDPNADLDPLRSRLARPRQRETPRT
jgi:glycosyltransferase involved in cell wall biosynthesis